MKTVAVIYMTLLILTLCGCQKNDAGGTTTGNPLVGFTMTGSSGAATVALNKSINIFPLLQSFLNKAVALPPPMLQDSVGTTISLNEAWISVKQVEFKASETVAVGEIDGDSVSFQDPTAVNLIASSPQFFGQVRINTTSLRRVKMQLHNVDVLPANAPLALTNKSIYWKGSVSTRQFTFSTTEGYEYELAGPNGVPLAENSNILLSIKIASLFKKIDMTAVTDGADITKDTRVPATNPCPLINGSAVDIYTCFIDGLKTESNLGRDDANDGELTGDAAIK